MLKLINIIGSNQEGDLLHPLFYMGDLFTMPLYSVENATTGEIQELNLKFSELETFLTEHPELKQIFIKAPSLGDPVRLGLRKPPESFREILRHAKGSHKHSTINTF